ncbi:MULTISPECIES: hypothetical protein [Streptomyces]|uniref:ARB-07466-like C-terminal domain-containing protein n=1 Tax=Streptomyces diastaticus subsp. diastaticus TaxID=68040 RepID=A0ABQ1CWR1_STRDI|nr:hypothetical protein [Streptomyces sp. SID8014]GFH63588.1 hypothetical protein Srut_01020 [Streptomyces rutgersensis]GFH74752.1 hypothetical protein Sdia_55200 [Streptomyces diastaticus subsp. diastaticus]GGU05115.1 hypothetical protein GCM10015534_03890 [Streptomyces diastaticus subsp. diastaticus]
MGSVSEPSFFRRGRVLRVGAALVVLLALAGYLAAQQRGGAPASARCVVRSADDPAETYELSAVMAVNAATISAVGTGKGMPERAVTIALATAIQESSLRNIDYGDRDSLGLFQQRPSQGWGTPEQIMDPVYSSEKFYEHLAEVPGYSRLPLTVAAQRVQKSGFPQAYAKHERDASLLAAALTGRAAETLTCGGATEEPGDEKAVRAALTRDFGKDVLPAAGAAGSASGADGAADGPRVVEVPVPSADGKRRGWELAHWAVAHATKLGVTEVTYAGRSWRTGGGWETAAREAAGDGTGEVRIVLSAG